MWRVLCSICEGAISQNIVPGSYLMLQVCDGCRAATGTELVFVVTLVDREVARTEGQIQVLRCLTDHISVVLESTFDRLQPGGWVCRYYLTSFEMLCSGLCNVKRVTRPSGITCSCSRNKPGSIVDGRTIARRTRSVSLLVRGSRRKKWWRIITPRRSLC
jgi:hypothetical protein